MPLNPNGKALVKKAEVIDVNLGHAPETFVRAAFCQCNGKEPSAGSEPVMRADGYSDDIDNVTAEYL